MGDGYGQSDGYNQVRRPIKYGLSVLAALWLGISSFYTVSQSQEGVVTRFDRYVRSTGPGLHLKLPFPIEKFKTPAVTEVYRIELGFKTINQGPPAKYEPNKLESHMLTGDENIVQLEWIVQFRKQNPRDYLFNVKDPHESIEDASEASMRAVIGDRGIDAALTAGKTEENIKFIKATRMPNIAAFANTTPENWNRR